MDRGTREAQEAEWVHRYNLIIDAAVLHFLEHGEWPAVDAVQRKMDLQHSGLDVALAMQDLPRLPGELRTAHWAHVTIPMRFLKHMPKANQLLGACFLIIQLGVAAYFSEMEPPMVSSNDPTLIGAVPGRPAAVWFRAGQLVFNDSPNPFAGGNWGDDWWQFHVNGAIARRMSGLVTIEDYFDRQAIILQEALINRGATVPVLNGEPPSEQVTVFVLMPFGEPWSITAFDAFRRAAQDIDLDPKIYVYRADDIAVPGRITDQIIDAIVNADVVLADITGVNPNVMWELGYAQALDKQIVIVNQDVSSSPFDVQEWRQAPYSIPLHREEVERIARFIQESLRLGT